MEQKAMFRFDEKTAAVTGAASGIGKATALVLARQGAEVLVVDVNQAAAAATAEEIKSGGGKARPVVCDVTNEESVAAAFASIDRLDILVNSAGISHIGNLENTTAADFERLFSVNVKGVFLCMQAALRCMKKQGSGVIINLASIANHVGLADRFAYSMTKGAVHAMTLSVAKDYIGADIRCNSISPARVHTPFVDGFLHKNYPGREEEMFRKLSHSQPIGRMASPDEVAALILYLSSDEASFITGMDYPIDGGVIHLNS
ncbi:SDR family NAD(P)-dependent oxidoreductase [Flavisolibacter nicotianae]|uniref:SDR family NAD(P)-dependent oxidoreductase n=1 Tax=Flavisolibacter nicotianae TaxID=2364882 RepID=UPI001F09BE72|nr:SDR family oxidoreductase [Flavisolibacter nicotianae]